MTPVQGVVVGLKRGSMEIRLESRSTITTKRVEGIGPGDAVEVAYDFTHNRVEAIWLKGQMPKPDPVKPTIRKPSEEQEFVQATEILPEAFFSPSLVELEGEDEEEGAFSFPSFEGGH